MPIEQGTSSARPLQEYSRTRSCAFCSTRHDITDLLYESFSGEYYCFSCVGNVVFPCFRCGNIVHTVNTFFIRGEVYCRDCREEFFRTCMHDGELYPIEEMIRDTLGNYIHRSYAHLYVNCAETGLFVERGIAVQRNGRWYHPNHVPIRHVIHQYSYKPDSIFHKLPDERNVELFMGVELEIERGGSTNLICDQILSAVNPEEEPPEFHMYGKRDSSVNNGFEIVTHPATFLYHMEKMPWGALLEKAKNLGFNPRPRTCGLHVHLSRRYFGYSADRQDVGIAKLLYLIEKFWNEVVTFSRRTYSSIERWADRYGFYSCPMTILEVAKDYDSRYKAVNIKNRNTIEIRVFRGTLDLLTLRATLQFCNLLAEVAKNTSIDDLKNIEWGDFVKKGDQYNEMLRYMIKRGLPI